MQPFTCSMLSLILAMILIISAARSEPVSDTYTDFINASCQATRYPDLCFKTLSPYAPTIQTNRVELASAALTVSLKSAKSTSNAVRKLWKGRDLSRKDGQVVADCLENMSDSVDEMEKSMVAMKGVDLKEKMGNVRTWVSAALTDEDTCMDGFEEDDDGKVKGSIRGYVVNVAELTSIALSLISNISSP